MGAYDSGECGYFFALVLREGEGDGGGGGRMGKGLG